MRAGSVLSITNSEESSNKSLPADDSGGATHATGLIVTSDEVEPLYRTSPRRCQEGEAAMKKENFSCLETYTKKSLSFFVQVAGNAIQSLPSRTNSSLVPSSPPAGPPRASASLASSSITSRATPTTMKLSARLKSGHW